LVRLYFSLTKEEQVLCFERRKTDPLRQWKLSEVDLQAQDRWEDFTNMKYEMLRRTHTSSAPWTIIRSMDKHKARLNTMKVILNSIDYDNRDQSLVWAPEPAVVVSGARELELMEAQRYQNGKFTA
jgi:polyphosphate kinase